MKAFAFVFLVLTIWGCGGSGNEVQSTFEGTFAGEWQVMSSVSGGEPLASGVIDMVVSERGQISGRFTESSPFVDGTLSGQIRNNGEITFTVTNASGRTQYGGEARLEDNYLRGFFGEVGAGYINFPGFDLRRQP